MTDVKPMTKPDMVAALMRGNSSTGKQGWSFANALNAMAKAEAQESDSAASSSMTIEGAMFARDAVLRVLRDHQPYMSDKNESEIDGIVGVMLSGEADELGRPVADTADLAIRTCLCGESLDGFDEYTHHLQQVFGEPR